MSDFSLDELAEGLSEFAAPVKPVGRSAREERIIAGFEDIQRFVDTHGRPPQHGEERDIFERLYAVRLDQLRKLDEARPLLEARDRQGLLSGAGSGSVATEELSLDDLAAELGDIPQGEDIRVLKHVMSSEERRAAEEIANRAKCEDFERFKPLFHGAEQALSEGRFETRPFGQDAAISREDFFILGGQLAYVAEVGEAIKAPNGATDARMRVIFSNGTESNLLMRSLQRALYKDPAGRRVVDVSAPNLFSDEWDDNDVSSGTIYVLRSQSTNPFVVKHRELIHKIGVTGSDVESRIAGAAKDPTYLLADVEVVATYKLASINRKKLESIFHRVFSPAQLDLTIEDRFGNPVKPREWFLVPLHVIDEAINRIYDGSIIEVTYDPQTAQLVKS